MVSKRRNDALTDHENPEHLEMVNAVVELLKNSGAINFYAKLYVSDDAPPQTWVCFAEYPDDMWETASATSLRESVFRLLETCVDGSICGHCHRKIFVDKNWIDPFLTQNNEHNICAYIYDPSTKDFVKGCY